MNSYLLREAFEAKVKHFIFPSCTVMLESKESQSEDDWDPRSEIHRNYFGVANTKIYVEKINIRIAISKLKKIEKLQIKEKQFLESKERKIQDRRDLLLKQIKQEERSKIVEQKDHLWRFI